MSQTSFLLSGLSSTKAPVVEGKGGVSPEVSESEGEGFFAQLAQLVSGDGEAAEVAGKDAALTEGDVASEEAVDAALLAALSDAEGEDGEKLAQGEEAIDAKGEKSASAGEKNTAAMSDAELAALKLNAEKGEAGDSVASRQQAAKQDGEVLLQRLNESSQVLSKKAPDSQDGQNGELKTVIADGNKLPQSQNSQAVSADEKQAALMAMQAAKTIQPESETAEAEQALKQIVAEMNTLQSKPQTSLTAEDKAALEHLAALKAQVLGKLSEEEAQVSSQQGGVQAAALMAQADPDNAKAAENLDAPSLASAAAANALNTTTPVQNGDIEVDADLLAKANNGGEPLSRAQQEALMRQQMAAAATSMKGEPDLAELQAKGLMSNAQASAQANALTNAQTSAQANMSQTASAVQAAVNPQAATPMSAFAAIPWTPAAMQNGANQPQQMASQAALDAAALQQLTDTSRPSGEVKAEHLAQQLASSFGHQASTTAAKLDAAVAQTPLQMSQNQAAEAANALSERVNMMMSKNLKHVDIRLDPPELGRLQIKLSVNNDQASVQFTVASQGARDLVEQSMPRLREMMQQQGLQLAQSSVQQQDAGSGRQAFAGNQAGQDGQGNSGGRGESSGFGRGEEQDAEHNVLNRELYVNASKDRVDYYA